MELPIGGRDAKGWGWGRSETDSHTGGPTLERKIPITFGCETHGAKFHEFLQLAELITRNIKNQQAQALGQLRGREATGVPHP